jgi:hypothetical protein
MVEYCLPLVYLKNLSTLFLIPNLSYLYSSSMPSNLHLLSWAGNTLTYRQRLEWENSKWSPFRKALMRGGRDVFDSLVDQAFKYVLAGTVYPLRVAFDVSPISSLST